MPELAGIHHISITVTDIQRSAAWYKEVLGLVELMEEKHPDGSGYALVLGKPDWSLCVGLHVHDTNGGERFSEARTGLDHVGFLVSDRAAIGAWETRLTELGVEHSAPTHEDSYAVLVFRDPDNVQLEFFAMG